MDFHAFSALRWMLGDIDGQVKNGYASNNQDNIKLLGFISMPSFDPIINWEIFKSATNGTKEYFVAKTYWDALNDFNKFNSLQAEIKTSDYPSSSKALDIKPTIVSNIHSLSSDFAETIIDKLKSIKISPFPSNAPIGCDGTFYELSLKESFHNLDIRWWDNGPENWSELTIYIKKLIDIFNEIIKANKIE
ncbi:hypothetical protein [Clostridium sp. C8-1-8]|uniref:hypothetical protein n=1 Tax=Clostridium sp. C8-1-8 TaxID=2698831 RepID=UPI00136C6915|nr:hypothetical protein [Clostridium sp. C8-1-8]